MGRPENVRYENQFYRPRRVNNNGLYILFFVTVVLVITTIVLAVVTLKKGKKDLKDPTSASSSANAITTDDQGQTVDPTGIIVVTPTPTPAPTIEDYQNQHLYPAKAQMDVQIGTPKDQYSPSGRGT